MASEDDPLRTTIFGIARGYSGPKDTRVGRFEAAARGDAEVRKVFADSEDVCVLFDLITDSPAVIVLVAE